MLPQTMPDTCVHSGGNLHALATTTAKNNIKPVNPEVFQDVKRFEIARPSPKIMPSSYFKNLTNLQLPHDCKNDGDDDS